MIKKLFKNELFNQIMKFGVVGGIAFIIDYICLIISKEIFGLSVLLSAAIAFIISVIFNYILSIKWVFNVNKEIDQKKNFIIFIVLSIIGLILTEIIMWFGTDIIKISYLIVKIFATAIVMVFNFITRKIFLEQKQNYHLLEKLQKNKKIIIIPIMTIISYVTLCYSEIIESYNVISIVILYLLYEHLKEYLIIEDNKYIEIKYISILLSILMVLGNLCIHNIYDKQVDIVLQLFSFRSTFKMIGFFGIIKSFLNMIVIKSEKFKVNGDKYKYNKAKIFVACFIAIIIAWLPYLLTFFPGTLSADSTGNINAIMVNGVDSDHHTIIHILLIKLSYIIGTSIFNSLTGTVLVYSIIQIVLMALIFAYSIIFLYCRNINKKLLVCILLFYALVPIFGFYSIVMWKDILFAGGLLLLTIESYKLIENTNIKITNAISFTIVSIITLFSRNNAIYMYYILAAVMLIIFRKQLKIIIPVLFIVFFSYFMIKGPIYSYFGIRTSASAEYIGIPMQQIGRMIYKDKEISKDQSKKISKILDTKIIKEVYNPTKSDDIKFHEEYNGEAFNENKLDYLSIYLQLVRKYPTVAIESYAISTLGYWYPNTINRTHEVTIIENDLGLKINCLTPRPVQKYMEVVGSNKTPLVSLTWSTGLLIWVIGLLFYVSFKRKNYKALYAFVPTLGIWFSIMLATPVYNEVRYVFGLYTTLPILFILSLYNDKNIIKR